MRIFVSICVTLFTFAALAFNSADWHGKRELFAREAERLMAAYTNCLAHLESPATDVLVPVETFEDGTVKLLVSAKKAQYFLDKGLVWAEDVVVKKFKKDGSVGACIEAKNCVVDRFSKSGWAQGLATVTHGKTVLKGTNVYFSSPDGYVKVFEGADISSEDMKLGGGF